MKNDKVDQMPEQELSELPAEKDLSAELERFGERRLDLEAGNYAILNEGIIHLHTKDDRELFSVDRNSIAFERKVLGVLMQVYLLGFNAGRNHEANNLKRRLDSAIALIF